MRKHNENRFRLKPKPPRSRDNAATQRLMSHIAGDVHPGTRTRGTSNGGTRRPGARIGRGFAASRLTANSLGPRARRVTIKARIVRLQTAGATAVFEHFRYIRRDGVSRDGQAAVAYGRNVEQADLDAFQARGADDRHQFRFIVAPEDAKDLDELRGFTRHLMARMETDLGTRLDWVAVDHWDTDQPHTHIVLRGQHASGGDLVIAGDYIAQGMRIRAREVATEWLGPRTELEIQTSLRREVDQERWTSLDRELKGRTQEGLINLSASSATAKELRYRQLLADRLLVLQRLGLAHEPSPTRWQLRDDAEAVLRSRGERGDIIRTMQRAFSRGRRELSIFDAASSGSVIGRVTSKGLVDELSDQGFMIVDGTDGRGHYVTLPHGTKLEELPVGGIVEVRPTSARSVDRNLLAAAKEGLYNEATHVAELRASGRPTMEAEDIVASHVRRLEALRRGGVVDRVADGLWRVPPDLVARASNYDRRRSGGVTIELHSHLPIEQQVRAVGATWLDQQLVEGNGCKGGTGFAASVGQALEQRQGFLVEHGVAKRDGAKVLVARDLLARLRRAEITSAAKIIEQETGLKHRGELEGIAISGVYRRPLLLASGRFAMLDDGLHFSLVPWRPVIEQRLGQSLTALVRGEHVSWDLGRKRGLSM